MRSKHLYVEQAAGAGDLSAAGETRQCLRDSRLLLLLLLLFLLAVLLVVVGAAGGGFLRDIVSAAVSCIGHHAFNG